MGSHNKLATCTTWLLRMNCQLPRNVTGPMLQITSSNDRSRIWGMSPLFQSIPYRRDVQMCQLIASQLATGSTFHVSHRHSRGCQEDALIIMHPLLWHVCTIHVPSYLTSISMCTRARLLDTSQASPHVSYEIVHKRPS